jgi:ribosomal protein S18 acetylase RimI-like enzyme
LIDFCFGLTPDSAEGFLAHDFKRGNGIFGYLNQFVAVSPQGEVIGTMTIYPSRCWMSLSWQSLLSVWSYFGLVGMLKVFQRMQIISSLFKKPRADSVFIANVCIAGPYRSQGIFPLLLKSAIDKMIQSRIQSIELDVSSSNERAQKLYERLGFEVIHETELRGRRHLDAFRRMEMKCVLG